MKYSPIALLFVAFSVWSHPPERIGAVEFDRSDRYLFPSEPVGDHFRVDVILPLGYEPDQRYPVVYVTDANYLIFSAAASYLAQATNEMEKIILVGIGWDVPSITRIRVRDFSPTCDADYRQQVQLEDHECGQADAFIAFIRDELQPFIDTNYQTNGNNTLVGYSFGGLFALHVLFNSPDVFDRYLIGSASMRWDDEYVFKAEARYAAEHEDLSKQVYLSAGGLEKQGVIPHAYRMYEQLETRNYPNLEIELDVIQGETHMTSINPFVIRGLRSVGFAK